MGEDLRPSQKSFLKNFIRHHIILVIINGTEHKPRDRTVNAKYLIFAEHFSKETVMVTLKNTEFK